MMGIWLRERLAQLREEWQQARHRHPRLVVGVAVAFAITAAVTIGCSFWLVATLRTGLPDQHAISHIGDMDQATSIYDAADQPAFTIYKEQRLEVPLSQISRNLIRAILAVEDQRFYQHRGFDVVRIGSAALANVRHRRAAQGGSTITQQLARQSFLRPDKTMRRKMQELILAARIEYQYSKPHILEMYLNKVYFGDGLYGIEAASRGYFGKHASELNVEQAALLAGLVKSPSNLSPTANMNRAIARRNLVLQAMLDAGDIDRSTWQTARTAKVTLRDTLRAPEAHGQYFKEQVRRELIDRFGWQRVYQGGLRVFTTLDMPTQIAAESAVADSLKTLDQKRRALVLRQAPRPNKKDQIPVATSGTRESNPLQAALIALEPDTGHVRAMVGGRDFSANNFNRAVQAKRQPGSAFKPFVYAAALEAGYTPATVLDHLDDPVIIDRRTTWTPDDEHSTGSSMTIRTALRTSSNRAAVRMLQQVGISRAVQEARNMGIGDVPSVPSLALGSGEVTLQAMTAAYAAFANQGIVPKPVLIRRVEDQDGLLLYQAHDTGTRAISDVTAFLMSNMLADVVNAGTAAGARSLGFKLPAAGKTGTTNDFHDAWFIGFTPKLATGVWVGFDQPRTILPRGFAAGIAVPLWASFMKVATKNDKPDWLTPPPGVVAVSVCRVSGQLAGDGCRNIAAVNDNGEVEHRSMVYTEYFARGTEPTTVCALHTAQSLADSVVGMVGEDESPSPALRVLGSLPPPSHVVGSLPPPPRVVGSLPPAPTATSGASPEPANPEIAPLSTTEQNKRGFWSRLFRGDRDAPPEKPSDDGKTPKKKPGQ